MSGAWFSSGLSLALGLLWATEFLDDLGFVQTTGILKRRDKAESVAQRQHLPGMQQALGPICSTTIKKKRKKEKRSRCLELLVPGYRQTQSCQGIEKHGPAPILFWALGFKLNLSAAGQVILPAEPSPRPLVSSFVIFIYLLLLMCGYMCVCVHRIHACWSNKTSGTLELESEVVLSRLMCSLGTKPGTARAVSALNYHSHHL